LEDVSNLLLSLRARIPALEQRIDGLAEHITSAELAVERTATYMAEWEGVTARPAGWSPSESGAATEQQAGDGRPIPLRELNAQIALLKGEVDESRQSLGQLNRLFDQDLEGARLDGKALEEAALGAQNAERQLGELMTHVSAEVDAVQLKIEQVLAGFVQRAEQALRQSREVLEQAEPLVSQGAPGPRGQRQVGRSREENLVALVTRTTAMRTALDQARAHLLGRWEEADQGGGEDYAELVADLDRYAEVVEGRVRELLDAVDVVVAQTELQLPSDP
jgi:hypothetical protein